MLSLIMYFVIPLYKLTALYMYCIKKVQLYENHIHHLYPSTWKEVRRNPLFRKVGIWKEKKRERRKQSDKLWENGVNSIWKVATYKIEKRTKKTKRKKRL